MAIHPVPSIVETDYPAFQRICEGRLQGPAYADWWWLEQRNRPLGNEIVPIEITPKELREFCEKRENGPSG